MRYASYVAAAIAVVVSSFAAQAADLPRRPVYKAPPEVRTPAMVPYAWANCGPANFGGARGYVQARIGWQWKSTDVYNASFGLIGADVGICKDFGPVGGFVEVGGSWSLGSSSYDVAPYTVHLNRFDTFPEVKLGVAKAFNGWRGEGYVGYARGTLKANYSGPLSGNYPDAHGDFFVVGARAVKPVRNNIELFAGPEGLFSKDASVFRVQGGIRF